MESYLVKRHGSNAANQSMTPAANAGIVTAENYEAARKEAAENFLCYNNQHLELVPESEADSEDWNDAIENEAAASLDRDSFQP